MKVYHELLKDVLYNGREHRNRTGVKTLSVFGRQARFDLSKGFPLLTTKKVFFRGIVEELLWFLRGETNIKSLVDKNVHIWDEWRAPYGINREFKLIKPKVKEYEPYNEKISYAGLNAKTDIDKKLRSVWLGMMKRCYDKEHRSYEYYGAKNISVCKAWHDPKTFIEDAKKLPHWWYKLNNWENFQLDKDYYGSNQYSPETCVWLSTEENKYYTENTKNLKVKDQNGDEYLFLTQKGASDVLKISKTTLNRFIQNGVPKILKRDNKKFLGWEFEEIDFDEGLLRLELINDGELGFVYGKAWRDYDGVDQIEKVYNQLINEPESRRIILNSWHPYRSENEAALPPCHLLCHFKAEELTEEERLKLFSNTWDVDGDVKQWVEDGLDVSNELDKRSIPKYRLNLLLYQRSCDLFLGVPFNIASYSLLLEIFCKLCNMIPGEFVHSYGDLHLYENHLKQVVEQLSRDPKPLPRVEITKELKTIEDLKNLKYEDIKLEGYDPHPAIKAEVAV